MKIIENQTITIIKDGKEVTCDLLFTSGSEETGKGYMAFTDYSKDENGKNNIYVKAYDPVYERMEDITSPKELALVDNVINQIKKELEKKLNNTGFNIKINTVINEEKREEITRLENQTRKEQEKAIQETEEQEIERLFNENEWVKSHLAERREMEAAQERGELTQSELEDLQKLVSEFNRVRQQIIEERKKAIEDDIRRRQEERNREIDSLYNTDEWVREHLTQQSEIERDLAQIESEYTQRQAMVQRNRNLPDIELENLSRRRNALQADLNKLKEELNQRRQTIETNYGRDLLAELQDDYENKRPLIYHFVDEDGQEADISLGANDVDYQKAYEQQLAKLRGKENDREENLEILTIEENNYATMTDEQLQALLDEYKAEYSYRVHQENGLIKHDDDLISKMNEVEAEIKRRQDLKESVRSEDETKTEEPNKTIHVIEEPKRIIDPTKISNPAEPDSRNRTLEEILNYLMAGEEVLGLSDRNYNAAQGANISIVRGLKASMFGDGPLGYRLVKLPQLPAHVITAVTLLGKKISSHLRSSDTSKNKIAIIRKRLDELSVDDLMTIYREYRGNKVIEAKLPSFMNDMILERINRFVKYEEGEKFEESRKTTGKTIEELKAENAEIFRQIYAKENAINEIDSQKLRGEITEEEAEKRISEIVQGSIGLITTYRQNYDEISRRYVGDSGILGFKMGIDAAKTGMNLPGRIASQKNRAITKELQSAWSETSEFEGALADAISKGNEEEALSSFVTYHNALSRHTAHEKTSLWDEKSVGVREYTPNPTELDYREDPFFKDLTRSVMSVTAIATAADVIMKEAARRQMVAAHNSDIRTHNADVDATITQVRQSGKQLSDKAEVFGRGAAANAHQGHLAVTDAHERQALDDQAVVTQGDWLSALRSSDYSAIDGHNHMVDAASFTDMSSQLSKAQADLTSGAISGPEYLKQITTIANSAQASATAEFKSCLETMERYAQSASGSNFDLTAAQGGLKYMIDNSENIINMNNALGEVIDIGTVLQQIPPAYAQELGKLPSNLVASLITSGMLAKATAKLSEQAQTVEKAHDEDEEIHSIVEESVRQEDRHELIRDAELRYYNMPKLGQTLGIIPSLREAKNLILAQFQWKKIQEIRDKEELSDEDVETIKGAFR